MSRSGYSDDCENLGLWRGAVERALSGKRGQAFLREMLVALDALPEKRLIGGTLVDEAGDVCAIGSVGVRRGLDMSKIDIEDSEKVAAAFGIARAMAAEIEYENDEANQYSTWDRRHEQFTPEQRFAKIRAWVVANIVPEPHELIPHTSTEEQAG